MKIKDRVKPKEPPVPAGTYRGILVHVIDIGEQSCKGKKGDFYQNQVVYTYELVGKTKEIDGQTKVVDLSRTFGFTRGANSAFRKFVQDWTGKKMTDEEWDDFDPGTLLSKEAMLSVVHNDTGEYANISTAMTPFEGDIYPRPTLPLLYFDMDRWDDAVFEKLPEWAQERIKKSTQYQKEHVPVTDVAIQPQQAVQTVPATNVPNSGGGAPF